ncbi:glycosyltransferase family 2 protein [Kaistia nematophila]|uniref:Glycosyltransferase family A protein n=1 Tax=Kaistia nematophila TaxID=2994654 RepID=A0A9X3E0P4_9HYPH|nr:glycosyltransferase family A protein [Kaistia nematophila]MCX5569561.1 glycosyltransferase family A protein [Kaistia nematophila]
MTMDRPRVSVVMPAFNRADYVAEALRSLQTEPGIDAEILVVDDGSTDGCDAVVAAIAAADPRVRLIRQDHRGVSAARNAGLAAATGEFLTFLDSDDVSAPGRILRQVTKLAARPDIAAVVGQRIYFNDMTADFQPREGSLWEQKLDICLASAVFRRSTFERFGGFDEALTYGEDIDFYFRLFEADSRFIIEIDTAIYYRRHAGNMTNDRDAMHRACLKAYHNSMLRRRATGRTRRLDVFFFRQFDRETEFGGCQETPAPAAATFNS